MVKFLHIKNYALIDILEMYPSPNLNIVTGETGAGKSIMLGAVGLLLGNRTDTKILLDKNNKCYVEGAFDISAYKLKPLFQKEDANYEEECVIRREISPAGKSRAFVNDSPVPISFLKTLGKFLMDIHSQHESLQLGDHQYQLNTLDAFASHPDLLHLYQKEYTNYKQKKDKLAQLKETAAKSSENTEYQQFLLNELEEAHLDSINQEEIENELKTLENAEDIKLRLSHIMNLFEESEHSILHQIKEVQQQLQPISHFSSILENISQRVESNSIELLDLSKEIQTFQETVAHTPDRILELQELLNLLYHLQKKNNVSTVSELITVRDNLSKEINQVSNLDDEIKKAEKEDEEAKKQIQTVGIRLTESRKLAALNLSDEIEKVIHKIGIENGTTEIKLSQIPPSETGLDAINILFSANKGIKPQEINEIASGGEFSRLIFAIKYLIADKTALPTIIFDEIDSGVSGQVALQMSKMMQKMSKNHQVICISHLPQLAASGDAHYFVYKDHGFDRTVSKVKKLDAHERIQEIAKMIGGEKPQQAAIQSAEYLLYEAKNKA